MEENLNGNSSFRRKNRGIHATRSLKPESNKKQNYQKLYLGGNTTKQPPNTCKEMCMGEEAGQEQ